MGVYLQLACVRPLRGRLDGLAVKIRRFRSLRSLHQRLWMFALFEDVFLSCLFFFFDVKQNKKGVADHDGRATPFLKVLSLTFRPYVHSQMSLMAILSASFSSSDQKKSLRLASPSSICPLLSPQRSDSLFTRTTDSVGFIYIFFMTNAFFILQ